MMRFICFILRGIAYRLMRLADKLTEKINSFSKTVVKYDAEKYNMFEDENEKFFSRIYWYWIEKYFDDNKISKKGSFLDLGCGYGRFTLPLAEWALPGAEITGVDISKEAVRFCELFIRQKEITNTRLVKEDINKFLSESNKLWDVVLLLETIYMFKDYEKIIFDVYRKMKPNGIFILSFRTKHYNYMESVYLKDWNSAEIALNDKNGRIFKNETSFSWSSSMEMRDLFEVVGFKVLGIHGIGVSSGINGDYLEKILKPYDLSSNEQKKLLDLEIKAGQIFNDSVRYCLIVGKK